VFLHYTYGMTQMTFYRLHSNPDAPCFCAEHAYSGLWGRTWSEDGSQTQCWCDGQDADCRDCDGSGWEDAQYGYSACWSATDLVTYMKKHGIVENDDKVIIFDGRQVGTGFDGEPLAVPSRTIEILTWSELLERTN
jgi:hypothetical protein